MSQRWPNRDVVPETGFAVGFASVLDGLTLTQR
jgi:hypothetical protein